MALISCPECGENLSTLAKSCPHCGYPVAEHKSEAKYSLSPQDDKPSGKYTVETIAFKPDAPNPFDNSVDFTEEYEDCETSKKELPMRFHKFNHYVRMPIGFFVTLVNCIRMDSIDLDIKWQLYQMYLLVGCILYLAAFIGFFKYQKYSYWCCFFVLILALIENVVLFLIGDYETITSAFIDFCILIYYIKRRHYFGVGEND